MRKKQPNVPQQIHATALEKLTTVWQNNLKSPRNMHQPPQQRTVAIKLQQTDRQTYEPNRRVSALKRVLRDKTNYNNSWTILASGENPTETLRIVQIWNYFWTNHNRSSCVYKCALRGERVKRYSKSSEWPRRYETNKIFKCRKTTVSSLQRASEKEDEHNESKADRQVRYQLVRCRLLEATAWKL